MQPCHKDLLVTAEILIIASNWNGYMSSLKTFIDVRLKQGKNGEPDK